jgi:hypothetical protein
VKVTHQPALDSGFWAEVRRQRKAADGLIGIAITESDVRFPAPTTIHHGLCYEVRFPGNVVATYDREELEVIASTPSDSVDEVIGRVVESVWISKDRYQLALVFADGTCHIWFTNFEGSIGNDCRCWIEHIDNFDFKGTIRGAMLSGGSHREASEDEDSDHDVHDQHFITMTTDRGRLIIDLRVQHNGYYGGSLDDGHDGEMTGDGWTEVIA